jgi:hypothetical protein
MAAMAPVRTGAAAEAAAGPDPPGITSAAAAAVEVKGTCREEVEDQEEVIKR